MDNFSCFAADTIAAIATPAGCGGVGVIRVSGKQLLTLAEQLTHRKLRPRYAHYVNFYGDDGQPIDSGIAIYFVTPHSFTGEDVLEIQAHGGSVVMQMLLKRCLALGARLASPGEFSRRAFLNNKIDLAQAESIADLIDASSEAAVRCANRTLQGVFSQQIQQLLTQLTQLRTQLEASLDFPEEGLEAWPVDYFLDSLCQAQQTLATLLHSAKQGHLLRDGIRVALVGQPNSGKSSLLNALAGDEIALVSEFAGTTRDSIREQILLNGVPLHIIDTAGLREDSIDPIEAMGMKRTWKVLEQADVVLLVVDADKGMDADDKLILTKIPQSIEVIILMNKADLLPSWPSMVIPQDSLRLLYVSAKTHQGLDALKSSLLQQVGWQGEENHMFIARYRHLEALQRTAQHLHDAYEQQAHIEFFAEELRLAQQALAEITGAFSHEDLLGEIFGRFCIGK